MSSTAATDKDLSRDSGDAFLRLLDTIGSEDAVSYTHLTLPTTERV